MIKSEKAVPITYFLVVTLFYTTYFISETNTVPVSRWGI